MPFPAQPIAQQTIQGLTRTRPARQANAITASQNAARNFMAIGKQKLFKKQQEQQQRDQQLERNLAVSKDTDIPLQTRTDAMNDYLKGIGRGDIQVLPKDLDSSLRFFEEVDKAQKDGLPLDPFIGRFKARFDAGLFSPRVLPEAERRFGELAEAKTEQTVEAFAGASPVTDDQLQLGRDAQSILPSLREEIADLEEEQRAVAAGTSDLSGGAKAQLQTNLESALTRRNVLLEKVNIIKKQEAFERMKAKIRSFVEIGVDFSTAQGKKMLDTIINEPVSNNDALRTEFDVLSRLDPPSQKQLTRMKVVGGILEKNFSDVAEDIEKRTRKKNIQRVEGELTNTGADIGSMGSAVKHQQQSRDAVRELDIPGKLEELQKVLKTSGGLTEEDKGRAIVLATQIRQGLVGVQGQQKAVAEQAITNIEQQIQGLENSKQNATPKEQQAIDGHLNRLRQTIQGFQNDPANEQQMQIEQLLLKEDVRRAEEALSGGAVTGKQAEELREQVEEQNTQINALTPTITKAERDRAFSRENINRSMAEAKRDEARLTKELARLRSTDEDENTYQEVLRDVQNRINDGDSLQKAVIGADKKNLKPVDQTRLLQDSKAFKASDDAVALTKAANELATLVETSPDKSPQTILRLTNQVAKKHGLTQKAVQTASAVDAKEVKTPFDDLGAGTATAIAGIGFDREAFNGLSTTERGALITKALQDIQRGKETVSSLRGSQAAVIQVQKSAAEMVLKSKPAQAAFDAVEKFVENKTFAMEGSIIEGGPGNELFLPNSAGVAARTGNAFKLIQETFFGSNPKAMAYQGVLNILMPFVAKKVGGEGGNLTEQEQERAKKLVPNPYGISVIGVPIGFGADSIESAKIKISFVRELLNSADRVVVRQGQDKIDVQFEKEVRDILKRADNAGAFQGEGTNEDVFDEYEKQQQEVAP